MLSNASKKRYYTYERYNFKSYSYSIAHIQTAPVIGKERFRPRTKAPGPDCRYSIHSGGLRILPSIGKLWKRGVMRCSIAPGVLLLLPSIDRICSSGRSVWPITALAEQYISSFTTCDQREYSKSQAMPEFKTNIGRTSSSQDASLIGHLGFCYNN